MFTKTRILFSLIFLVACSSANAQEQIERLFRGDRQNAGIDVVQTPNDEYLFLSAGRPLDSTRFEYYTVSKFDLKGNFLWSKDYSFEHKVYPDGSLTLLEGDSFVISGVLDTTSINKILLKAGPSGDVVWTKGFGRDDDNTPLILGDAPVDGNYQGGFLLAGDLYGLANITDVYLSSTDTVGNQLWGKSYGTPTGVFNTTKVQMAQDSGAIICGTSLDGINPDMFLIKTDSIGNIEWSREYGEDNLVELGTAVAPTPDGGYLLGGRKINPLLPSHPGILIKTDTFGTPQWVSNVDFLTSDTVLINDIIIAADGDAVVSGSLLGANENFSFMMKIDMDGDVVWKRRYKASTRQFTFSNGLRESTSNSGGFIYLTSSDDEMTQSQIGPYLIKTDEDGATICDTIIDGQLVFPTTVTIDTLELTTLDATDTKDITVVDTLNYSGFNLTTVELETFGPYCPEEIFSDTLDATTDGAIAYEWSTDETTPTIIVTEPGEYMVTVTIGEDYCYQLCTSSTIGELPLPAVELDFNDDSFCSTGIVTVNAAPMATDNIVWSTGEMQTNSIMVDSEITYGVTVSNTCGSDSAEIAIVFDTAPPVVDINEAGDFCADGTTQLTATASFSDGFSWSTTETTQTITVDALGVYSVTALSNFCDDGTANYEVEAVEITGNITSDGLFCANGEELLTLNNPLSTPNTILWSTDEMTNQVSVAGLGNYTVTFSDFCDTGTAEFEVLPTQIEVSISGDDSFCEDGDELLAAVPSSPVSTYTWSTGDLTPTTTALNQGDFTLTVTDFCGQDTASITILCPIEYEIPNAFTPNGDTNSEIFLPVFAFDPTELVEYEFIIYSRWGEKVFETNNPLEGWDGMVKEKEGASDVYIFTVKGVNGLGVPLTHQDLEKDNHGDVTLLR